MPFLESQFPPNISYGSSGGPGYSTDIVALNSGFENRNSNWSVARAIWDVSHGIKNQTDLDALIAFFRVAKGRANGFRFKDWLDYKVTQATGILGTGFGNGRPFYQLGKIYISGSGSEIRAIKKPVSGTPVLLRGGAAVAFGGAAGQVSLDTTTGIIKFVLDAAAEATSITVGTTTQIVTATNPGGLIAGNLLYLAAFTGADASLVNGIAHTINSITGSGPYTFTLATNTLGKVINTVGGGTCYKYPQANESLTWAGEFDVPARFDTDQMKASINDFSIYSWGSIPVVEIRQ